MKVLTTNQITTERKSILINLFSIFIQTHLANKVKPFFRTSHFSPDDLIDFSIGKLCVLAPLRDTSNKKAGFN